MLKWLFLGVLLLGLAGFGCVHRRAPDPLKAAAAAAGPALGDDFRATKRGDVPLYRSGPRQMDIPDTLLPKDALVRVVRTQFGYTLVRTESGLLGWVASEDLGVPATPPVVAAGNALPPLPAGGPASAVNRIDALNARASGQNTLPVGGAAGPPSHPETNGDSAIVARYRIDAPAAGTTKAASSATPASAEAANNKPAPPPATSEAAKTASSPTPGATKAAPSPTPEAAKAASSPTPEPSP